MSRYRSKLVQAAIAAVLVVMSAALWLSPGVLATRTLAADNPTPCPTTTSVICVTNSPTAGVTLNGNDQTVPYNLFFTVNNSVSGSWNVTITSTRFTGGSHTLPLSVSSITGVTILSLCSNNCPANTISYTPAIGVPVGNPAAKFYNNNPTGGNTNAGVGIFNLQAAIQVLVPANSYAVNYTNTITIAFISGSP
jgi:hypothetical protein